MFPKLVYGTFNNTMACLHNACLMPQTDGFDPVCLFTAPKRAKPTKEPQVKNSTTSETKIQKLVKLKKVNRQTAIFKTLKI